MKAKSNSPLMGMFVGAFASMCAAAFMLLAVSQSLAADELTKEQVAAQVTLAEAAQEPAGDANHSVAYQEHRIGGRLERITITRQSGITEIYRNNRTDTVWSAQENEIGEVPNMRQWIIGTW